MSDTPNPLIQNVRLPGRTFQLPSRGALYTNHELDSESKNGEVHVHPMSALTEINLKNPDQLFNGKAIQAVLAECVPSIKKPLDLFGRDIDALLFFLRLTTYGSEYRIEVKHTCEGAKQHTYAVQLEQMVQDMRQLDPTVIEQKRVVTLKNGQKVFTRPLKFSNIIELFHQTEGKTKFEVDDIKALAITNLLCMIEKVDDITDPNMIEAWILALTTPMINQITDAASSLNEWGPEQIITLKCRDCSHDMKVELPLNPVDFFTE
jgi:hypothetical protein